MPNIFSKLADGVGALGSRMEQNLMPAPADGLLSPEQISAARRQGIMHFGIDLLQNQGKNGRSPTLGEAVGHGLNTAQDTYGANLESQAAQSVAARQQKMLAGREAINAKYAPGPADTPDTIMAKAPSMYMDHLRNNDFEAAKAVEPIVAAQLAIRKRQLGENLQSVNLGDRKVNFDPLSGKYTDPATGKEITDLTEHMNPDQKAQAKERHDLAVSQLALNASTRELQDAQGIGNAWHTQTKGAQDSQAAYANWKAVLGQARLQSPEAYKGVITAFANSGDGLTSGLRLGMLHYAEKVDPSIHGRMDIFWDKNAKGAYPQSVLDGLDAVVEAKHKNVIDDYSRRYNARIKVTGPTRGMYIDPPETVFTNAEHYPEAKNPNGSSAGAAAYMKGGIKEIH